jgi:hypothetical protein
MKWNMTTGAAVVVGLTTLGAFFYFTRMQAPPERQASPPPVVANAPQTAPAEPAIRYPVPTEADATAIVLPPLEHSDKVVREALAGYFGQQSFQQLFQLDSIVRHIVVTVDNLPRETVATRLLPTRPARGAFLVSKGRDGLTIAPSNSARYLPYVELARRTDAAQLVRVYASLYPLFQRAYEELGYPKGYFNDRLVAVIDHLLAAPEPEGPVRLVQPHILYKFADPQLESASAGQKIMLRMGTQNEAVIKAKLREVRSELTRAAPGG